MGFTQDFPIVMSREKQTQYSSVQGYCPSEHHSRLSHHQDKNDLSPAIEGSNHLIIPFCDPLHSPAWRAGDVLYIDNVMARANGNAASVGDSGYRNWRMHSVGDCVPPSKRLCELSISAMTVSLFA